MKKKKTDPADKARIEANHDRFRKTSVIPHRSSKRRKQRERRYDQGVD